MQIAGLFEVLFGIQISDREREQLAIAAAFHDIVHVEPFETPPLPPPPPEAEFESIEEAHAYIQDVGVCEAIYFEAVAFAIRATVPSFGLEMDTGMGLSDELPSASDVRQPYLFIIPTSQHYRVGAALALADVATPGLCPPELYRAEGDRRFREQKPNLEF